MTTVVRAFFAPTTALVAARHLVAVGVGAAVVTAGRHGVFGVDGRGAFRGVAPEVDEVNPIGAGDAFAAGLGVALDRGEDLRDAVVLAVATGSASVATRVAGEVDADLLQQAGLLATIAPQHANAARSEAARLIVERAPGRNFGHVFFTNGGADAVENAVRMARLHTGRRKVLARYRSYHGNTTTAINLTGDPRRWPNDYGAEGIVHFQGPFLYRRQDLLG